MTFVGNIPLFDGGGCMVDIYSEFAAYAQHTNRSKYNATHTQQFQMEEWRWKVGNFRMIHVAILDVSEPFTPIGMQWPPNNKPVHEPVFSIGCSNSQNKETWDALLYLRCDPPSHWKYPVYHAIQFGLYWSLSSPNEHNDEIPVACTQLESKLHDIPFEATGFVYMESRGVMKSLGVERERQLMELIHPPWSRRRAFLLPYHQWQQDNHDEPRIPLHLLAEIVSFL